MVKHSVFPNKSFALLLSAFEQMDQFLKLTDFCIYLSLCNFRSVSVSYIPAGLRYGI